MLIKGEDGTEKGKKVKKDVALQFYVHVMKEMYCNKFIRMLRQGLDAKRKRELEAQSKKNKQTFIDLSKNDIMELELKALGMKGYLMLTKIGLGEQDLTPELIEIAAKSPYFTRYYINVQEEALLFRAKAQDEDIQDEVLFPGVSNPGIVAEHNALYFIYRKTLHCLRAQTEAEMRAWTSAVIYMTTEYGRKDEAPVFPKFQYANGTYETEVLFKKDEPNYSYEHILKKKAHQKQLKELNELAKKTGESQADKGKKALSDEELSGSDDEESESGEKKPQPAAGPKKEEGGLMEKAKGWFNW
jgi:hypothetical protein